MKSTLLKGNSKKDCPNCGTKGLFTNDSEKNDPAVHYHCLNCNYQFVETAEEKDLYEKRGEENKKANKKDNPVGVTLIILIAAVIFAVSLSQRDEQRDSSSVAPVDRTEQLTDGNS